MSALPAPERFDIWPFRLALGGIGLVVFGLVALLYVAGPGSLYHLLLLTWGGEHLSISPYRPFVDIGEYLAALECQRLGWDVFVHDPCDVLGRPHIYPVWLTPHMIGLDTSDRGWLGATLAVAFICSVAWIANPRTVGEASAYLVAVLSPASVYAIERANMDLLVFVSVVAAAFLFSRSGLGRVAAYLMIFAVATLKFYPIAAMGLALNEKRRRFILVAVTTSIGWIAFLYAVRHALAEMRPNLPDLWPLGGVFGGFDSFAVLQESVIRHFPERANLLSPMVYAIYGAVTLAAIVAAAFLSRGLRRSGIVFEGGTGNAALFLAGALILIFCFFTEINIFYREIFLLGLLPYIFDSRRRRTNSNIDRYFWTSAIALIIALLWFEFLRSNVAVHVSGRMGLAADLALFAREPLWWIFIIGLASLLFTWLKAIPSPHSFVSWRQPTRNQPV
jgi:hypothetical protein